jgi:hypothetical protein
MAISGATILNKSITFHLSHFSAAHVCAWLEHDEEDGTQYTVEEVQPGRFAIGVYEADGSFVFYL